MAGLSDQILNRSASCGISRSYSNDYAVGMVPSFKLTEHISKELQPAYSFFASVHAPLKIAHVAKHLEATIFSSLAKASHVAKEQTYSPRAHITCKNNSMGLFSELRGQIFYFSVRHGLKRQLPLPIGLPSHSISINVTLAAIRESFEWTIGQATMLA